MDNPTSNQPETAPPSLGELFARYLNNTDAAQVDSRPGLVQPYDTGVAHPVDAQLAWKGALASLASLTAQGMSFEKPTDWTSLVVAHESRPAVAMAAGNYPQLMRDLPGLLQADDLADLLRLPSSVQDLPGSSSWALRIAKNSFAGRMLAAGVLRLAGQFAAASEFLNVEPGHTDAELQVLGNERGALAWDEGNRDAAIEQWMKLSASAAGQFNLGMAALFSKPSLALPYLQSAIELLAEDDPWRHLAGIYLALAEMRA